MKIILLAIIVVMFAYIGISIKNSFKNREKLLNEIVIFFKNLETEIGFMLTKLNVVINNANVNASKTFKGILSCFNNYLNNGNITELKEKLKIADLKDDEQEKLINFFISAGKEEASNEVAKIKKFTNFFEDKARQMSEQNIKYCPLAIKLSILASLAVCVILI